MLPKFASVHDSLLNPHLRHATELPFRAELFSVPQLQTHARGLAARHKTETKRGQNSLLAQLEENEALLRQFIQESLAQDPAKRTTSAAEWLLDNFYLIEEQIQLARRHLPKGYSSELPRLVDGASAGLPRVYDLVLELISHVDAQLDEESLHAFVAAYQEISPLKLGELWAVPIMLRLGLIENLQRVTTRLTLARQDRDTANRWIDRLHEVSEKSPSKLVVVVAEMAQADLPLSSAFVAEFCQLLARHNTVLLMARGWLEQQLGEQGRSIELLVHQESENQAADQVSISHTITSLRFLASMDWKDFVESLSVIQQTLCQDPAGVFATMDFATRDRYRQVVENLARHSNNKEEYQAKWGTHVRGQRERLRCRFSEKEVAEKTLQLTQKAADTKGLSDRTAHIGYYLIDKGLPQLEKAVQIERPLRMVLERVVQTFPLTFYAGGILLLTALFTWLFYDQLRFFHVEGWRLGFFTAVFALCASQTAVALMNWFSTLLIAPRLLPRLDFSNGIAPECRTMVVIPTMLSSAEGVGHLIETIEIHYLANRDQNLWFALLTDHRDAPSETMPGDAALVKQARDGIAMLNEKYSDYRLNTFFLFHRPRRFNKADNRWMGWERKRGKLTEFNALLRGNGRERFSEIVGDLSLLSGVKYVITLDTDTQLPREAARQLAGTMAHPLNRPVFDESKRIVTEGYGILQPRVGVSLPSGGRSVFAALFAGELGIDPYTRAVSDVYQDLFQEGSFIGKGIYDVDAFEKALAGRFPENTILSHDLIESVHARSGLVSDVQLYEDYPSRYSADISRRHRWIRGDWQIARWLMPRVRRGDIPVAQSTPQGDRNVASPNPLSALSRWKILDNLRRSLVPIALLVLLAGAWMLAPAWGRWALSLVLALLLLPSVFSALVSAVRKPEELPLGLHLRGVASSWVRQAGQGLLTLAMLPYEAFINLDAIGRTLVRTLFTRKRMLDWQTSSDAERAAQTTIGGFYKTMWFAPVLAVDVAAVLCVAGASSPGSKGTVMVPGLEAPATMTIALVLLLWFLSPLIAWWISQPLNQQAIPLDKVRLAFLRRTARKTWRFFEEFVSAKDNWLPPDNFQEVPQPEIATRTSPTNMGLALLANLAARDFGYLSVGGLIDRTQKTLDAMQKLERHRGHFYNWYETRTLASLQPLYISSVDSGNLAGHLLTLGPGLMELADEEVLHPQIFAGLYDTAEVLGELTVKSVALEKLIADLETVPRTEESQFALLRSVTEQAEQIVASLAAEADDEVRWWTNALARMSREHLEDVLFLAPWLGSAEEMASNETKNDSSDTQPGILHAENASSDLRTDVPEEIGNAFSSATCFLPDVDASPASSEIGWVNLSPGAIHTLRSLAQQGHARARARLEALKALAAQAAALADMDFAFLLDPKREVFTVGYNVHDRRADNSFYDLLASEARLCSYVAIATEQVSQDHWFSLGRLLIASRGEPLLASWSGSMFEYLMPLLVMPNYPQTLLDQTCRSVVKRQIEYGKQRGVPWGISESGYNSSNLQYDYQYHAFGVPGLGLKRGLTDDLVIAPYASMMALMVDPAKACENLQFLANDGRTGPYGFYEAVDYTPSRLPPGQTGATVRSYMVHHQGMGLLALDYALRGQPMQRRFLGCPVFKATELLLQERVPNTGAKVLSEEVKRGTSDTLTGSGEKDVRRFTDPHARTPEVHLLSNGRYHAAVTSAGGGYSRWRDLAVTRWREDATRDCWGTFIYLRDVPSGQFWSAAHQPTLRSTDYYEATFTQARAEFRQRRGDLDIHTAISVSPEDDIELRRVTLINYSDDTRAVELTSYAEVVLADFAGDAAHPAFSNLFVTTEFNPEAGALLCTRRARKIDEKPPFLLHLMLVHGDKTGEVSYETDRSRFVGRGGNLARPAALNKRGGLSNTTGSVLDPIVSLRQTVLLKPYQTTVIDVIMGVAESREIAVALAQKYQSARIADRAFELAWTHSQVMLHYLNASEKDAQLYGRMAGALIYADPARRADSSLLAQNRRGQSDLWSYGISGDFPIVLLQISHRENLEIARQLVQAHTYWRMKGLAVELVLLYETASVYRQSLHDELIGLIVSGQQGEVLDKPKGIFVRHTDQIPSEDRVLLQAVARIFLSAEDGPLLSQLNQRKFLEPRIPALTPSRSMLPDLHPTVPPRELNFDNGHGGFTKDGHEYVITLKAGEATPAPWVNVLANPYFGTVVSESGSAYTWVENAHEFRLTPWSNDPVQDPSGEALYIRDEESGQFWSPAPLPARGATPYVVRHGFGYTIFEHTEFGIVSELTVYVAMDAPVKFTVLKLRNVSGRPRRLSVTNYCEWVLGELRGKSLLHVQTEVDIKTGALLARNRFNKEFADRIVFLDMNDSNGTLTGDRREFLGRNGSPAAPAALRRVRLSNKVGAGLDPCGAMQVTLDLPDGQERQVSFRLGVGKSVEDVQSLIWRFRSGESIYAALQGVWEYWNRTLGAINIDTPDPAVNAMANGWLLYQTLSCRIWGRTGFYQSGGAYGFRDQLQDVMALVHAEPALTREQLLRAAARQFREGDALHWWHPPAGRGVRTHFSDDYLWLPYVTCRYVTCVADTGVLDERVPFIEGRRLEPHEEANYDLFHPTQDTATLYDHCVKSIENGLRFGEHGLPLMGCGDWNDGMNLVGEHGKGESVWLAFFLFDVLKKFEPVARQRGDAAFADRCLAQAETLRQNIESQAWDGAWYRRAWFDDGRPLGSATNEECQIDSLPQSWSILTGAGDPARSRQGMQAVNDRLIRRDAGLIQLFDPPFDQSDLNPGYIRGYIPGVRENGGQYTHAAIWTAMAFAEMGDSARAWELFHLLNPITHGSTPAAIKVYKVEPYVVAADVYAVSPHTGRGGWTWYTGSAGWMYRLLVETLLGVHLEGDKLYIRPHFPKNWPSFKIHYRYYQTVYHITLTRRNEADVSEPEFILDDQMIMGNGIPLINDQHEHFVETRV